MTISEQMTLAAIFYLHGFSFTAINDSNLGETDFHEKNSSKQSVGLLVQFRTAKLLTIEINPLLFYQWIQRIYGYDKST